MKPIRFAAAFLSICVILLFSPVSAAAVSEDLYRSRQWYLDTLGVETAIENNLTGRGVTIAVIDAGCRFSHEDLENMRVTEAVSFLRNDSAMTDAADHGTCVMSILASEQNNGKGMLGMAPDADYMVLRAFSATGGKLSDIITAMNYAVEHGADVINMSLGASDTLQMSALEPAVKNAIESGCIVVSAVGNSGGEEYYYPAAFEGVIGVGSVSKTGYHCLFSNINDSVDITAPGASIFVMDATADDGYALVDGTSVSTPMITAMAAWAKQVDPAIDSDAFLKLLKATAIDKGVYGYDTTYGWGVADADRFVRALLEADCPCDRYSDLNRDAWYHEAMDYAIGKKLLSGVSEGQMAPNATVTRGMLVTVLYRMSGASVSEKPVFSDVPTDAWYAEAVTWAADAGIVSGTSAGRFSPDAPITREQFAAILYRYAGVVGIRTPALGDLSDYSDVEQISPYARNAISWANSVGLIRGKGDHLLDPGGSATRAETAAILMRFSQLK